MDDHAAITRCPHCQTAFRVRPEQLSAAAGRVRCGSCLRIFSAPENEVDDSTPGVTRDDASPVWSEPETEAFAPEPESTAHTADAADTFDPEYAEDATDADIDDLLSALELPDDPPEPEDTPTAAPGPAAPETGKPAATAPSPLASARDKLDHLTGEYQRRNRQRWVWRGLVVLLLVTLIGQIGYWQRQTLSGWPVLASVYQVVCADCAAVSSSYPTESIRALSTSVQPAGDNRLQLDAVIVNRGDRPVPYPDIVLRLFAMNGDLTADGRFTPGDYLPDTASPEATLAPGRPVSIRLPLNRPVGSPANFRLAFVPPGDAAAVP